jgi:hypothetical protein
MLLEDGEHIIQGSPAPSLAGLNTKLAVHELPGLSPIGFPIGDTVCAAAAGTKITVSDTDASAELSLVDESSCSLDSKHPGRSEVCSGSIGAPTMVES